MNDELKRAIALHHEFESHHRRALRPGPARCVPGELAVATGEGVRRVVCVIAAERGGDKPWHNVLLIDSCPEMATDLDAVFLAGEVAPYPVVLLAELYLQVYQDQLSEFVGQIDPEIALGVWRAAFDDGESLRASGARTGIPLGGVDDPRRRHKADQIDDTLKLSFAVRNDIL